MRMEGNMYTPPVNCVGWQTIYRRVVEWRRRTHTENELAVLNEHITISIMTLIYRSVGRKPS